MDLLILEILNLFGGVTVAIHLQALTSVPGPGRVKTIFLPQKLRATGDDPRRHDGLSIFLLDRVWSQPGRNLGPR